MLLVKELGIRYRGFSVVIEGCMLTRMSSESSDPLVWQPRRSSTAKALRITSECREIGECTRVARMRSISVDGQGHYNPDRSEDLWGKAVRP